MFIVVSRSDVQFGFEQPFSACPTGRGSKIPRPKKETPRKKSVHPCCAKYFCVLSFLTVPINVSIATWVYNIFISLSGDIQLNPRPKNKSDINFSICLWNLNSIAAHNYAKVFLLKAYIAVYNFDIVCIFETYLDSAITSDDGNLEILRYNLIRSDHPSNRKRGGVCIYYKSALPLRVLNTHYLQESISFELKIGDKFCDFIFLDRSPSPTQNKFENFSENLKEI